MRQARIRKFNCKSLNKLLIIAQNCYREANIFCVKKWAKEVYPTGWKELYDFWLPNHEEAVLFDKGK